MKVDEMCLADRVDALSTKLGEARQEMEALLRGPLSCENTGSMIFGDVLQYALDKAIADVGAADEEFDRCRAIVNGEWD